MMIRCVGMASLGLAIGVLSGLFGVGGGFFLVPMLNVLFNITFNIAIGSSLCQMVGISLLAALRHRSYGNVDFKLALFVFVGSIGGAEFGARLLMWLKDTGSMLVNGMPVTNLYLWINIIYISLLSFIGTIMFRESRKARRKPLQLGIAESRIFQKVQSVIIKPMVSFHVSHIKHISIWGLLVLGFVVGTLSGLLGVGGGFVFTPALIYIIGVPTSVAIGTGLFQMIFISAYGGVSHFLKGNVDLRVVGCILAGSLAGSQVGAWLHNRTHEAHIRYYLSWIIFCAVVVIVVKFLFVIELL
ncbi:MAG: sulfite exporter TauE/SafE family protein [Spirochaetota bacterium]|nr:MAG: sulfite exporter TauE/SafE family protein [Spirochaetota bacterium]